MSFLSIIKAISPFRSRRSPHVDMRARFEDIRRNPSKVTLEERKAVARILFAGIERDFLLPRTIPDSPPAQEIPLSKLSDRELLSATGRPGALRELGKRAGAHRRRHSLFVEMFGRSVEDADVQIKSDSTTSGVFFDNQHEGCPRQFLPLTRYLSTNYVKDVAELKTYKDSSVFMAGALDDLEVRFDNECFRSLRAACGNSVADVSDEILPANSLDRLTSVILNQARRPMAVAFMSLLTAESLKLLSGDSRFNVLDGVVSRGYGFCADSSGTLIVVTAEGGPLLPGVLIGAASTDETFKVRIKGQSDLHISVKDFMIEWIAWAERGMLVCAPEQVACLRYAMPEKVEIDTTTTRPSTIQTTTATEELP